MTLYGGLDAGEKATHLCVIDGEGTILWRGGCATDPEALAFALRKHAPGLVRVPAETGTHSGPRIRRSGRLRDLYERIAWPRLATAGSTSD